MADEKRGRGSKSGLSEADKALWRRITEGARPLSGRIPAPAREGEPVERPARPPRASRLPRAEPVPTQPKKPQPPELAAGRIAGVARSQAERLRRGRLPIEARLDLHGYSQEQAHRALNDFLARAQDRGKRCVLVVTGKGTTKEEGGVLRRMVPQWLNQPPNRERILAFDQAQPKDGGLGALYVLLKRRRSS
ncbi:MAG: Smr/MutS family protein [Kiloniellales bacterium]